MYGKYMKLHKDGNVVYIKEEICGVEIDNVRLNLVTRATLIHFFQFFTERCRLMPLIVKNEKEYLNVAKDLYSDSNPIKGSISRIGNDYIAIDISKNIDNESYKVNSEYRVVKDIRKLFENV